jgi:phosphotriesterase-related protein
MKIKKIFTGFCLIFLFSNCHTNKDGIIMTVNGPVMANKMGVTLIHEHILVDFIGADSISEIQWNNAEVERVALPYLKRLKGLGCKTFVECTPAYLGRDPILLKALSRSTGLNILTNTGYYGAGNDKFIPQFAFSETADQIADRWSEEWTNGIEGSGVKPGFIKIGVGTENLSDFHKKLVKAAARTHLRTGLTIVSHTGLSTPAFEQLEILNDEGVAPDAFIWTHAQNEKDLNTHIKAARMGAWISLDGINDENSDDYVKMINNLKENGLLNRVLLSHDAGWYHPGEKNGGNFRGYSALFEKLIPLLRKEKFSESEIKQLLVVNPAEAFTVRVRKIVKNS